MILVSDIAIENSFMATMLQQLQKNNIKQTVRQKMPSVLHGAS